MKYASATGPICAYGGCLELGTTQVKRIYDDEDLAEIRDGRVLTIVGDELFCVADAQKVAANIERLDTGLRDRWLAGKQETARN